MQDLNLRSSCLNLLNSLDYKFVQPDSPIVFHPLCLVITIIWQVLSKYLLTGMEPVHKGLTSWLKSLTISHWAKSSSNYVDCCPALQYLHFLWFKPPQETLCYYRNFLSHCVAISSEWKHGLLVLGGRHLRLRKLKEVARFTRPFVEVIWAVNDCWEGRVFGGGFCKLGRKLCGQSSSASSGVGFSVIQPPLSLLCSSIEALTLFLEGNLINKGRLGWNFSLVCYWCPYLWLKDISLLSLGSYVISSA